MTKRRNNNNRSPQDNKPVERSVRLIHAILDNRTPDELKDRMLEWFDNDSGRDTKLEALENVMNQMIPDDNPSPQTLQRLHDLKQRLRSEGYFKETTTAPQITPVKRRLSPVWRVAAVVIPFFAILGGYFVWENSRTTDTPKEIALINVEVLPGVQKDVTLSDNSHVWINSDSRVTFAEDFKDERHVELQGEAFFEVAKDEQKPFIVHTEHLQVRVLGTEFEVTAYPDRDATEVVLHSGAVEVYVGNDTVPLSPGEKLTYNHSTKQWNVGGVEVVVDWRTDMITAFDKPLAQIFRMIGNYYDINVEFTDGQFSENMVYQVTFGKHITPQEVMDALATISGMFKYEIRDNEIVIERLN